MAKGTAAVYVRISKDEAGEHLGVDRQERACRELAAARGLTVDRVLVDNDFSAFSKIRRPAFEELVELLGDGAVSTVVAYHADRLYRRTTDLERLVDIVEINGAEVHTVAAGTVDFSTASGRMVARMLGAAGQHESERISERTRMKHDELARGGKAPGGRAPYGYRWEFPARQREKGRYLHDATESATVRTIARRILEGASLLGIARELDAAGSRTREGRPWHPSTVRAVVYNPAVVALRVHRREIAGPGEWEPILDRVTWEEVRAVLADPARKHKRPPRDYLLSGLVKNPEGETMNGRLDRGPGGERTRRTYATRSATTVGSQPGRAGTALAIGADDLERVVWESVLLRLDEATLPEPADDGGGQAVIEIQAELAQLATLRGEGEISLAEWMAARTPLQRRLDEAKRAAGTVRRETSMTALMRKPGAVRKAWNAGTLTKEQQREVIDTFIERITILPAARARWTPIDDRVDVDWR